MNFYIRIVLILVITSFAAKPYFVYPLKDLIVDENSDVTWRCEGIASPRATYVWYKNARLIPAGTEGVEISSNVLRIRNLRKNLHDGMYSCQASNMYGTAVTSAQLKILCTSLQILELFLYCSFNAAWNLILFIVKTQANTFGSINYCEKQYLDSFDKSYSRGGEARDTGLTNYTKKWQNHGRIKRNTSNTSINKKLSHNLYQHLKNFSREKNYLFCAI
jgi:hypothetical protein